MSSTSAKRPPAKRAHPKYSEMVAAALRALKERNGSSRQAILRFILASFQIGDEKFAGVHLKQALRRAVAGGSLQQTKGTGASGSFKLSKEEDAATKSTAKKVSPKSSTKKPAAKKVSPKPSAKKASANKPPTKKNGVKKDKDTKKPIAKKVSTKEAKATKKDTTKATKEPRPP
ncbi:histone H1-delta-like [Penaeus chinensis]|uniref:histone H1-delta-like n=1 Tax=Penaeus chinensis TaxID=139456 RepID=UPI001FB7099C|nr:histone H1-delta-like [Penaeus chinensis]